MPKVSAGPPTATVAPTLPLSSAVTFGFAVPPGVPPPMLAQSNPDTMVSAGLANNFNGRVESVWALPRKQEKGKKKGHYELFAEVNIRADDQSLGRDGIVTEYLKMDQLNQWVPSRTDPIWNGTKWAYTPAGGSFEQYMGLHLAQMGFPVPGDQTGKETGVLPPDDWRGWFVVPGLQNSRADVMKGTKWAHFGDKLREVGYQKVAPHINWGDFRQLLVGVYGTWVRFPFEFKGGTPPRDQEPGADALELTTLCLAAILDLGPISGKSGPVSISVPAAVPPATPAPAVPPPTAPTAVAPQAQMIGVAAPAQPAAQAAAAPPATVDPRAVSDAANDILATLAQARAAEGKTLTKAEAGDAVFSGLVQRGLDGAMGLRFLSSNEWMEADERTFGYDSVKGLIVPLQ